MKKTIYLILFLAVTSNLIACSIFNNENDDAVVSAIIEADELVIRNGLHFDVYYFAVAQSALPYIFWAPTVDDFNRVPNNQIKIVQAESLFSYQEGEPVVFYYWDEDISEIFSILIE